MLRSPKSLRSNVVLGALVSSHYPRNHPIHHITVSVSPPAHSPADLSQLAPVSATPSASDHVLISAIDSGSPHVLSDLLLNENLGSEYFPRSDPATVRSRLINGSEKNAMFQCVRPVRVRAALSTLPNELLITIFETLHTMDCPMTPLMQTCKKFDIIIRHSPNLWRRILVSVDSMPPTLQAGSTMACKTEAFLRKSVDCASGTKIEATFVIGQIDDSSVSCQERAERFKILMEKSEQMTFMCIIINPSTPVEVVIDSFKGIFHQKTFGSLESLMIASALPLKGLYEAFEGFFRALEEHPSKLGSLYFENVSTPFIEAVRQFNWWRRLRRVTLKGEYQPLHATVFEGCKELTFISSSGELIVTPDKALPPIPEDPSTGSTAAGMDMVMPTPNGHNHPQVVMPIDSRELDARTRSRVEAPPNLQWLRLGGITMSGLSQLNLQAIRFMVIQTTLRDYPYAPPAPHSIPLPNLEVLHIATTHDAVSAIAAPKLVTLCLQIHALRRNDANEIINSIFDGHEQMMKPENLSLNAPAHSKHVAAMLKKIPELKGLTLTLQELPTAGFYSMLKAKKSANLKNLRALTLDFPSMGSAADEIVLKTKQEVSEIVAARNLESYTCKFGDAVVFSSCRQCGQQNNKGQLPHAERRGPFAAAG
ncbi:hypothetical protein CPB86DRAFT_778813 [Serendipita vermifera]|nr:hypothetical protein CPB86DRAFT_778813 [Serendipita vermifera]